MVQNHDEAREIRADSRSIRQLLDAQKYAIDYYQREYKWQTKHIQELLSDLAIKFLLDYQKNHDRTAVERYGHYFLGSIIISKKEGKEFVIDGQQRLTTLTLLLIYLNLLSEGRDDEPTPVRNLIFSSKFSKKSFNIEIPDREQVMQALYDDDKDFDSDTLTSEALINIWNGFIDIKEQFPEELKNHALPFFIDWLLENVHVVKITAYSDADAYTVFETMNDRGLSLTPTEMLKGYLLSKIDTDDKKIEAHAVWKKHIADMNSLADELELKELDSDCIKVWLRSQYARNIRQRKKGARPEDWDKIGTEFHRWVRENTPLIGLNKSGDYIRFIEKDFDFYFRQFQKISRASVHLTDEFPHIFYNAQNRFTLQNQLLLAPLLKTDPDLVIRRKMRMVSKFVDILITRRMMNFHSNDYNTMQYAMFVAMKDIRGKSPDDLAEILTSNLAQEEEVIGTNKDYYLTKMNHRHIHYILSRITDYIEQQSGLNSHYLEYITGEGNKKYEVEHVWANHYEDHKDEFDHASDFEAYRNRFGGLLILQKLFNARLQ